MSQIIIDRTDNWVTVNEARWEKDRDARCFGNTYDWLFELARTSYE